MSADLITNTVEDVVCEFAREVRPEVTWEMSFDEHLSSFVLRGMVHYGDSAFELLMIEERFAKPEMTTIVELHDPLKLASDTVTEGLAAALEHDLRDQSTKPQPTWRLRPEARSRLKATLTRMASQLHNSAPEPGS